MKSPTRTLLTVGLAGLLCGGCSRKENDSPATATPPQPATQPALAAPVPAPAATLSHAAPAVLTPALLAVVAQVESDYQTAKDLYGKIAVLNRIDEVPPAAAGEALWRIFFTEQDVELREEVLNSLLDVEGEDQLKLDLLAAALQREQPQPVRLTAIDMLVDLVNPQAISILQNHLADPDQEIREAVADAVEDLQLVDTPQPQ